MRLHNKYADHKTIASVRSKKAINNYAIAKPPHKWLCDRKDTAE